MGEYNWINNALNSVGKFVESFGYSETRIPSDPYLIPETKINNSYPFPYTVEQTIRVTYNGKPKKRDPARNWSKK